MLRPAGQIGWNRVMTRKRSRPEIWARVFNFALTPSPLLAKHPLRGQGEECKYDGKEP